MSELAKRGAHISRASYHSLRQWTAIQPSVYRYLPSQYVDAFFERGEIRLSSTAAFSRHTDEARGDSQEGTAHILAVGAGRHFGSFVTGQPDAYILCGSFILSRSIMDRFSGCDGAIQITSVPDFGLEIAKQLAGFEGGLSGYCLYAKHRLLYREVPHDPFPQADQEPVSFDDMLIAMQNAGLDEHYFLKNAEYAYQAEYRLIWGVDRVNADFIDLICPEAIQFCRRVDPSEIQ